MFDVWWSMPFSVEGNLMQWPPVSEHIFTWMRSNKLLGPLLAHQYKFRLFTNFASQCQGQPRDEQGQGRDKQG